MATSIQRASKNLRSALDGRGDPASQGNRSPPTGHRQLHKRLEMHDQRIAVVFDIEFEPLGRKYRCAARPPGDPSRKRERRALEQEDAAVLSLDVARKPKPVAVAPDKECRDRGIENTGIERLKRRWQGRTRRGLRFPDIRKTKRHGDHGV